MSNAGIDYAGPSGTCNRDPETGIRYGIIPIGALGEFAHESIEAQYEPSCPACGADWKAADYAHTAGPYGQRGSWCASCDTFVREDREYPDEPTGWKIVDSEIEGFQDSSGDVWITKSPYYTLAKFCSPCAPGACYLLNPCDDGARAYCLGPDWFDDENPCPYPVFTIEEASNV